MHIINTVEPNPTNTATPPNPFLPPDSLTLLLGEPGAGKSLLSIEIAARLSRNQSPLPNLENGHESSNGDAPDVTPTTLLLSTEDSEKTITARAAAADSLPNHILPLPNTLTLIPPKNQFPDEREDPSLLATLSMFLPKFQKTHSPIRLLILDPLPALLGTYDCSHAASIRRLLTPLLQLAQHYHFSILGITHLNKSNSKSKLPLHRALNSIAYVALARSVLLLTSDQTNPTRKLLIPIKSNLAAPTHALAFNISDTPPPQSPGIAIPAAPAAHIEWHPTAITDHSLLTNTATPPTDPIQRSQLELAEDFLRTTLADGPQPSADVLKQSRALALSQRTLERARHHLQITVYFDRTTQHWLMSLPATTAT
ncbi:MAG: AAA family ATPase [Phycisphaerae bacterium]